MSVEVAERLSTAERLNAAERVEAERLDTRIAIVTPENIAFEHRVAGPFRRLPAYLLDLLISVGGAIVVTILLTLAFSLVQLTGIGLGIALVLWFVVTFFYHGLFEALWNGQTPGKRVCGLRVVTIEGLPIHPWQAILRNILRAADALPAATLGLTGVPVPTYLAGLVSCACTSRYQRLGDLACGTMVVIEQQEERHGVTRIHDKAVLDLAESIPRGYRPSRSLAAALSNYVARRQIFTPRQRQEISRHVAEPLIARWGLPTDTNSDLLLCAIYVRTFIAEDNSAPRADGERRKPGGPAR